MKAILINPKDKKVHEIDLPEIKDPTQINQLFDSGCKSLAHKFLNGDVLFVSDDVNTSDIGFKFGSSMYGFKPFRGIGIILNLNKYEVLPCKTSLAKIKSLIRF